MRIHSDILTMDDLYAACDRAGDGVSFGATQHGSRSHARAFDFVLSGTSGRRRNTGTTGADDVQAATWDEHGMFLAELFRRDPNATIPRVYEGETHFHWITGDRFEFLKPAKQHKRHDWTRVAEAGTADNSYAVFACTGCDAERRDGGW